MSLVLKKNQRIFEIIANELHGNRHNIYDNWETTNEKSEAMVTLGETLRDDGWKMLQESGELQWITKPSLIYSIVQVYGKISQVKFFSHQYLELMLFRKDSTPNNVKFLQGKLQETIAELIDYLNDAMELVEDFKSELVKLNWFEKILVEFLLKWLTKQNLN